MESKNTRRSLVRKFGWLAAAAMLGTALLLPAASSVAAKPEYAISVAKTADHATVPAAGAAVKFTYWVTNTGSGFLQVFIISDNKCSAMSADPTVVTGDSDGKLEADEVWSWTCTATTLPNTTNTVSVRACHDGSIDSCNNNAHAALGSATFTVGLTPAAPVTPAPSVKPPSTDTLPVGTSSPGSGLQLILVLMAALLGGVLVLTPAKARRR